MKNIILEGLDFTGKTPITKSVSDILSLKLINKELISNIVDDYNSIDKWESTLINLNSIDNAVFDRHFMSLLVYWSLTNEQFYNSNIDEEKVFDNFIEKNENSILIFRYSSFEKTKHKIFDRIDYKEERLSKHDLESKVKCNF